MQDLKSEFLESGDNQIRGPEKGKYRVEGGKKWKEIGLIVPSPTEPSTLWGMTGRGRPGRKEKQDNPKVAKDV